MITTKVPLWIDVNKKPKEERSALDRIVYEQCPLSKEDRFGVSGATTRPFR